MPEHKDYRDAGTGEYVDEQYAADHPDTTVSETVQDEPEQADDDTADEG